MVCITTITRYNTRIDEDGDIIQERAPYIYMGDHIYSAHYTYDKFKDIYQRRRDRLLSRILSSKKILFCRFEANAVNYTNDDIDNFLKSVLHINKNIEDITPFYISNADLKR